MYVQIDAGHADPKGALEQVPGVMRATLADQRDAVVGFEVESEQGHDVRRDLSRAIVAKGWGLLELRPMRMSLEEIFLHLTTEESPESGSGSPGVRSADDVPPAEAGVPLDAEEAEVDRG
jgi:hypothetical protein